MCIMLRYCLNISKSFYRSDKRFNQFLCLNLNGRDKKRNEHQATDISNNSNSLNIINGRRVPIRNI